MDFSLQRLPIHGVAQETRVASFQTPRTSLSGSVSVHALLSLDARSFGQILASIATYYTDVIKQFHRLFTCGQGIPRIQSHWRVQFIKLVLSDYKRRNVQKCHLLNPSLLPFSYVSIHQKSYLSQCLSYNYSPRTQRDSYHDTMYIKNPLLVVVSTLALVSALPTLPTAVETSGPSAPAVWIGKRASSGFSNLKMLLARAAKGDCDKKKEGKPYSSQNSNTNGKPVACTGPDCPNPQNMPNPGTGNNPPVPDPLELNGNTPTNTTTNPLPVVSPLGTNGEACVGENCPVACTGENCPVPETTCTVEPCPVPDPECETTGTCTQ